MSIQDVKRHILTLLTADLHISGVKRSHKYLQQVANLDSFSTIFGPQSKPLSAYPATGPRIVSIDIIREPANLLQGIAILQLGSKELGCTLNELCILTCKDL